VSFFFGNLFYIAQFQYKELPPECILAYMLMKYQFLLCVFFVADVYYLKMMGDDEQTMIAILKKKEKKGNRQSIMDEIK
jgi:hypothetical protein